MSERIIQEKGGTRMVAHRGLSGIETENTLAAFIAAGNRSYFGIETDVHVTADGKLVCIHDDDTHRVCGEHHIVEETDFEALRALTLIDRESGAPRIDLKIPTLREYIRACRRYDKTAVLELKNPFEERFVLQVIGEIREEGWLERVVFISFSWENMLILRRLLPEAACQFLTSKWDDGLPERLKAHALDLDIDYRALTQARIAALHEAGVKVNCWTCDDRAQAERLIAWDADMITSNILE